MSSIYSVNIGGRNQRLSATKCRLKLKMELVTSGKEKLLKKIELYCKRVLQPAHQLLRECDEKKFFDSYKSISTELDDCCEQLFLVFLPETDDGLDFQDEYDENTSSVKEQEYNTRNSPQIKSTPSVRTPDSFASDASSFHLPSDSPQEVDIPQPTDKYLPATLNEKIDNDYQTLKLAKSTDALAVVSQVQEAKPPRPLDILATTNVSNESVTTHSTYDFKPLNFLAFNRITENIAKSGRLQFNEPSTDSSVVSNAFTPEMTAICSPGLSVKSENDSFVVTPTKSPHVNPPVETTIKIMVQKRMEDKLPLPPLKPFTSPNCSSESSQYYSCSSLLNQNCLDSDNSTDKVLCQSINEIPTVDKSHQTHLRRSHSPSPSVRQKITSNELSSSLVSVSQNAVSTYCPPMSTKIPAEPPLGQPLSVMVTHINTPGDFYLQLQIAENSSVIEMIRMHSESAPKLPSAHIPILYGFYLAPFEDGFSWHRVQILGTYEHEPIPYCEVFYIDYGNQRKIPVSKLAQLENKLADYPPLAIFCALLMAAPVGKTWTNDSVKVFESCLQSGRILIGTIHSKLGKKPSCQFASPLFQEQYPVQLSFTVQGISLFVADYLVELEVAQYCAPESAVIPAAGYAYSFSSYSESSDTVVETCVQDEGTLATQKAKQLPGGEIETENVSISPSPVTSSRRNSFSSAKPNVLTDENNLIVETHKTCENLPTTNGALTPSGSPDWTAEIPAFPFPAEQVSTNTYFTAYTSAIINPHNFYVHFATPGLAKMDEMQEELFEYYDSLTAPDYLLLKEPVRVGSFWVGRYPDDKRWYRVQIVDILYSSINGTKQRPDYRTVTEDTELLVKFVDWGNTISTRVGELRPLLPKFCNLPRFAVPCSLANISPKASESEWSDEATQRMMALAKIDKPITLRLENQNRDGQLEILLWTSELFSHPEDREVLVNKLLVEEGLATGYQQRDLSDESNTHAGQDEPSPFDEWDPMSEEYNSVRNSYAIDVDDPELATTGYKSTDGQRICSFFGSGKTCPRRDVCHLLHVRVTDGATRDSGEEYEAPPPVIPEVGSSVYAQVSAIFTPSRFYIVLPWGNHTISELATPGFEANEDNLAALCKAMTKLYSSQRFQEDQTNPPTLGSFVAARNAREEQWLRATISSDTADSTQFGVFFVDFGTKELVHRKNICKMRPEFMHLPSQAVQCSMYLEPNNAEGIWSNEAQEYFENRVRGQTLAARILPEIDSSTTMVQLFMHNLNKSTDIGKELIEKKYAKEIKSNKRGKGVFPD